MKFTECSSPSKVSPLADTCPDNRGMLEIGAGGHGSIGRRGKAAGCSVVKRRRQGEAWNDENTL